MENCRRWEGSRDEGRMGDERGEEKRRGEKEGEEKEKEEEIRGGKEKRKEMERRRQMSTEGQKRRGDEQRRRDGVPLSESCAETFVLETLMSSFGSASTLAASTSALYLSHVR